MAAGDFLHEIHNHLVVVVGQVHLLVNRGQLKLVGGDFIVAGLHGDPQSVSLLLQVNHKAVDPRGNRTEIVVLELLVLG